MMHGTRLDKSLLPVQIPSNQMLRVFGSSTWLSTLIICWGIVSGFGALITSSNGYIVQASCLSREEDSTAGSWGSFLLSLHKKTPLRAPGTISASYISCLGPTVCAASTYGIQGQAVYKMRPGRHLVNLCPQPE